MRVVSPLCAFECVESIIIMGAHGYGYGDGAGDGNGDADV